MISIHTCGDPNDPRLTEPWMRDLVKTEGVAGYWIIELMLEQEEEYKAWELEQDIKAMKEAVCQDCSGLLEYSCPEAEFDDHEEEVCPYECIDGLISCHCTTNQL